MIIGFIIALIKKRPVTTIVDDIYEYSVRAINSAETIKVNGVEVSGEQKLKAAVTMVCMALLKKYPTLDTDRYHRIIVSVIESILSTPQKKG